ncbi:hypothetical protein ACEQ6A_15485 [Rhizobium brockwellii]|uniref:hypothetical protein n=1 Tax=Rhizobium brockwellii TaxID=3019932 RepID=UPI003F9583AB
MTLPRPATPKPKVEGPIRRTLPPVAIGQKNTLTPTFNKNANPAAAQPGRQTPPGNGQAGGFQLGQGGKLKPIFNKSAGAE